MQIKRLFVGISLILGCISGAKAQFTYGTTGLLHVPSAEMQRDKTVMIGGGYLNSHATPIRWNYNTWNYYINITFFHGWKQHIPAPSLMNGLEEESCT